jgi:glutamate 5-kinase
LSEFSSDELRQILGLSSEEIRERLGAISEEVVHRDQLVLNQVCSDEIAPSDARSPEG